MEGEGGAVKEEEENFCPTQGVSVVILTAKGAKIAKVCTICFSSFVPFALFTVHDFQPACPQKF